MKKKLLLIALIGASLTLAFQSQAQKVLWEKCLADSNSDENNVVIQTLDSGYIVAGTSYTSPATGNHSSYDSIHKNFYPDAWIVKLNKHKNIQWRKFYGGSKSDFANSLIQTTDGGYIFAGKTESNDSQVSGNHGGSDFWVVKLKSNGDITWSKCYGGNGFDAANSIKQTYDGGFIVAGYTTSHDSNVQGYHLNPKILDQTPDFLVYKLKNNGDIEWQKCYGGDSIDIAYSIIQTIDSGYLTVGRTNSNNGDVSGYKGGVSIAYQNTPQGDGWILKLNHKGNIEWQRTYGGSGNDLLNDALQDKDGSYTIFGTTESNDFDINGNKYPGTDFYCLAKLKYNGNIIWSRCYGGTDNSVAYSFCKTKDNGYVLGGKIGQFDKSTYIGHDTATMYQFFYSYIVKTDSTGASNWQHAYTGLGGADDNVYSIIQNKADNYIVAGFKGDYCIGSDILEIGDNDTLKGRISTSTGKPLANSKVYLGIYNPNDTTVTAIDSIVTNSLGNYSFIAFDSVVYLAAFPDTALYHNEMPAWADSAPTMSGAKAIKLHPGTTVEDFHTLYGANPGGSGTIGGTIYLCDNCKTYGSGLAAVHYRVLLADSTGKPQEYTWTDASGRFSFKNINLSKYQIWVDAPMVNNRSTAPSLRLTNVKPQDTGLVFTLYPTYLELNLSSGIEKSATENHFMGLYPNPSNGKLNIKLNVNHGKGHIHITDMEGRRIIELPISETINSLQIDISSLSPGIYFLHYEDAGTVWIGKFVKN